jgi:hypothetical protein
MDQIKGAIQLKEIIERAADGTLVESEPVPPVPADAPPVFHWLGVAPSIPDEGVPAPAE